MSCSTRICCPLIWSCARETRLRPSIHDSVQMQTQGSTPPPPPSPVHQSTVCARWICEDREAAAPQSGLDGVRGSLTRSLPVLSLVDRTLDLMEPQTSSKRCLRVSGSPHHPVGRCGNSLQRVRAHSGRQLDPHLLPIISPTSQHASNKLATQHLSRSTPSSSQPRRTGETNS